MNRKLLEILACPECKAPLDFFRTRNVLVCRAERLAFPVRDQIPVLLTDEAKSLGSEQLDKWDKERQRGNHDV